MKQYKSFIIILAIAILSTLVTTTVLAEENEISTINSNSETTEEVCLDAGVAFALANATDELEYIEIEEEEYEETYEDLYVAVTPYTMYTNDKLNVRYTPEIIEDNKLAKLKICTEVTVVGYVEDSEFVAILWEDDIAYVSGNYLQEYDPDFMTRNYDWNGEKLDSHNGRVSGPSGQETYYNLNMDKCVQIMRDKGYNYDYWVRSDGVKMYGNYVMVAADLSTRPKGTIVETTLGDGIVVDTGTFVETNPSQLDIAVAW